MKERTVILDTNVYGELLIEENDEELIDKIRTDKKNLIYGIDIIEKELEKTPIEIKYKGKELRKLLIDLFESLSDEVINITPLSLSKSFATTNLSYIIDNQSEWNLPFVVVFLNSLFPSSSTAPDSSSYSSLD